MAHSNSISKYNHNGGINEVWAYYDSLEYDNEYNDSYHNNNRRIINRKDVEDIVDGIIELIKLYK